MRNMSPGDLKMIEILSLSYSGASSSRLCDPGLKKCIFLTFGIDEDCWYLAEYDW